MTRSLSPPMEKKIQIQTDNQNEPFCFCLVVLIYFEEEETAKYIKQFLLVENAEICPGSILLTKICFRNFSQKKNDSLENFVRHSLANTARVARITKY